MNKFEVGKVYGEKSSDNFLKITKRTDKRVWFVHITTKGEEYSNDYDEAYKNVREAGWADGEYFTLNIGIVGMTFCAQDVKEDFEGFCKSIQESSEAREEVRENRARLEAEALKSWLSESGLTYERAFEIYSKISNASPRACEILEAENEI